MTELTPLEIEQIKREAEDYKSDFIISFWGDKITHDDIESTYAAALTSALLKLKAEIQAYREALIQIESLLSGEPSEENASESYQIAKQTLNQFK
jgi:hypothetical protein